MIQLTRRYSFSASHRLHSKELSEAENDRLYGKCNNPYGHGHNYEFEVTVTGPMDPETGRVVDLSTLDGLVRELVLEAFEHKNLNEEVLEFQQLVPTTENLGKVLRNRLRAGWTGAFPTALPVLQRVRIYETARNIFEI